MSLILNGTDGLSDVDGTAATPAIRGTDANTGIFFPAADTIAFSEGGAEAMRITSAGNVGIGTTSPSVKFQVNHSSDVAAINASGGGVTLGMSNSSANDVLLRMTNNSSNFYDIRNLTSGSAFTIGYNATERMRINSSGTLLIGNTSDANLPGNGTANADGLGIFSDGRLCIGRSAFAAQIGVNSSGAGITAVQFLQNGTSVGAISVSSNTSTAYGTSSDYRLKENIAPMTGALDKVAQLKPVTYKWKSNGLDGQGFIAHELAEIVPDAVIGEKDAVKTVDDVDEEGKVIGTKEVPQYQGIDTSFLVATLTAAIQELKATVDAQAARIAALESA